MVSREMSLKHAGCVGKNSERNQHAKRKMRGEQDGSGVDLQSRSWIPERNFIHCDGRGKLQVLAQRRSDVDVWWRKMTGRTRPC